MHHPNRNLGDKCRLILIVFPLVSTLHGIEYIDMSLTPRDLKLGDLIELSKVYASEYNMPELHDRVLVFDVIKDGWNTDTSCVAVQPRRDNDEKCSQQDTEKPSASKLDATVSSDTKWSEGVQSGDERASKSEEASSESKIESEPGSASNEESSADLAEKPSVDRRSIHIDDSGDSSLSSSTEIGPEPGDSLLRQHKIFVHSTWLAVQSRYFRSLFFSGLKETNSKEVHIKVNEFEEKAHLTLIEAIYKIDVLNNASVDELLAVLELADKYDVKFVFRKCKYVLQKYNTFEISKKIMHVIKVKHRMTDVEDLAITSGKVLANHFSPLDDTWQREDFCTLSEPCVQYMLSSHDLTTRSENTVFHSLMHWMEINHVDPSSLEPTSRLLASVRFELVTIDFLYTIVKNHPVATKMPLFQELYLNGMTYHALPSGQKQFLSQKPIERKKIDGGNSQYIEVVQRRDFEAAAKSGTSLKSDVFWFCGYKLQVNLNYIRQNRNIWGGAGTLNVLDIKKESFVPIRWGIEATRSQNSRLEENLFTPLYPSYAVQFNVNFPSSNNEGVILAKIELGQN